MAAIEEEFAYLHTFKLRDRPKVQGNLWRSVADIISSGFLYKNCSEFTRVFVQRMRWRGVKACFVALMDKTRSTENAIEGHCYAEVLIDGKWIKTDPTHRQIIQDYPPHFVFITDREDWSFFRDFVEVHISVLRNLRIKPD